MESKYIKKPPQVKQKKKSHDNDNDEDNAEDLVPATLDPFFKQ